MNIPPELQQLVNQGPKPLRIRSVTIHAADLENGQTSYLCTGKVEEAITESGIALATPQPKGLSQAEAFLLITAFLQAILVGGCQQQRPQVEAARGTLN